jgi:fumarate reductase subunit C
VNRPLQSKLPKSRVPARLDLAQSLTGLALGLFMWTHLLLVSSILLGNEAMYFVSKMMEAEFLTGTGHGYPIIVTCVAAIVFTLFISHAGLAMRKFPQNWKQASIFRSHMTMMHHPDTSQWWSQVATGFLMFFLGSVHIYIMMTHPAQIGPYESADRVWTGWMWPLYLVLLFSVEVHAAVGMYRLAVKWGVFDGKDPRATRKRLQLARTGLTVFFLSLGLASLAAYIKLGVDHAPHAGEPYVSPSHASAE